MENIFRSFGSFKYDKKTAKYTKISIKLKTYFSVTLKTYKINHRLNCDNKSLIYLLPCIKSFKQYVGETNKIFRKRWNNYKDNAGKYLRGDSCMQQHLFEHFQNPGHTSFIEDVSITLIDKTDPSIPTKCEAYW